jgi:hypothetical protein
MRNLIYAAELEAAFASLATHLAAHEPAYSHESAT